MVVSEPQGMMDVAREVVGGLSRRGDVGFVAESFTWRAPEGAKVAGRI